MYSVGFFFSWIAGLQFCGDTKQLRSMRGAYEPRKPPPCAPSTFSAGKVSNTPSKISFCSAIVVSSGLPITLDSQPLPLKRAASSGVLCGWMNSVTPSSCAFASTGWNSGWLKSRPATLPPMAAPFRPNFFTASSSCCTARSGNCMASDAKAANCRGCAAHSAARCSLWMRQMASAVSRSWRYQKGLMLSTCMSMPMRSIAARRCSSTRSAPLSRKCSGTPFTGGSTARASSPIRSMASWK